jgi:CheY-like chemotaxis protein
MQPIELLWIDDEIDLLQAHMIFLSQKGYHVTKAHSGQDALSLLKETSFNIVLLDENMPGMSGIEVLTAIKQDHPQLPVIMITKSEEENIMEEAIGAKIADYLIKPVNPNQILLSLKKNLDASKLVTEKTIATYQQSFRQLSADVMQAESLGSWSDVYQKSCIGKWKSIVLIPQSSKKYLPIRKRKQILLSQDLLRSIMPAYFLMKMKKNFFQIKCLRSWSRPD